MGIRDRFTSGGAKKGIGGRAVVLVNKGGGQVTSASAARSLLRVEVRPLPEGTGPDATISKLLPSYVAHLVTAGMELPVLLDEETGEPVGLMKEGLDEAMGTYFLGLEPEHGTWGAALAAKQKALKEDTGFLGDIRHGIGQLKDSAAAAKALPKGLKDTTSEWKSELSKLGGESHPAGEPIDGVGFDDWVRLRKTIADRSIDASGEEAFAESEGVAAGKWPSIEAGWRQQIQWNQAARALYDQAMGNG